MEKHLKKVNHQYIRYANCWEDADVLLDGLDINDGDKVLSIGSAGDNSFSLLSQNPKLVVAVDINQIQLNLIELKKASFKTLEHDEFLQFLGFSYCENRLPLFEKVQAALEPSQKKFWLGRMDEIEKGIIHQGKFEKYFQLFRRRILPIIHFRKTVHSLFVDKNQLEQKRFFENKWNSWRWRSLFKIFFSKFVMGRFGRDPKFLSEVKGSVYKFILKESGSHLSSTQCQQNYFLDYILRGKFGVGLPHYARKENCQKIKSNLDKLVVFKGYVQDVFKQFSSFNKFNLSNIFEYMDAETFARISKQIIGNSIIDSKFAYWNLMVSRDVTDVDASVVPVVSNRLNGDNGFFYSKFLLNQKLC